MHSPSTLIVYYTYFLVYFVAKIAKFKLPCKLENLQLPTKKSKITKISNFSTQKSPQCFFSMKLRKSMFLIIVVVGEWSRCEWKFVPSRMYKDLLPQCYLILGKFPNNIMYSVVERKICGMTTTISHTFPSF